MRFLIFACFVTALGLPARGQSPSAATGNTRLQGAVSAAPSADKILDRYVEAAGGRAAWQKLTSRVSMGTIEIPSMNLSGTVVIHEKAPDKILTIIVIAGSVFRQGFDGTAGWTDDPQDGLREQAGAELADTRREADFYGPLDLRRQYAKFTVLGSERTAGRASYAVQATPPEGGEPDILYFDAQTGLPLRVIGQSHAPQGAAKFEEDFSDYRNVDGVRLPFTISQRSGETSFTVRLGGVRHNVDLDDSEFAPPAVQ